MSNNNVEQREKAVSQELETLTRKWRDQNNKKIAAQTEIENAKREMSEILTEIKERFDVNSIEELRSRYTQSLEENAQRVQTLKESLEECETMRQEIETSLSE